MDFDPRDFDTRDDERHLNTPGRAGRGGTSDRDRDDDWGQPGTRTRDRDDADARSLGRGAGSERHASEGHARDRDHDPRSAERDRDTRERDRDGRDTFARHVHLPRGPEREIVRDRDREYSLRGSESRTLSTVGAFRVVSNRDLRDHDGRPADARLGDLRHLREEGLIETVRVPGDRDHAVVLTKEGRSLLQRHRDRDQERPQTFYAGLVRERELEHDLQLYRAYAQAEARLLERGAHIERVVLDHELKLRASTNAGCTSTTTTVTTTTAITIGRLMRFANGRSNTTCRTSMTRWTPTRLRRIGLHDGPQARRARTCGARAGTIPSLTTAPSFRPSIPRPGTWPADTRGRRMPRTCVSLRSYCSTTARRRLPA